ncbi:MAG: hypothetical protein LBI29_04540 [Rickettsiales bacterium]|jgi:hypothetical protein|nr:hypothetical protein [Rickettsiales bacterium]
MPIKQKYPTIVTILAIHIGANCLSVGVLAANKIGENCADCICGFLTGCCKKCSKENSDDEYEDMLTRAQTASSNRRNGTNNDNSARSDSVGGSSKTSSKKKKKLKKVAKQSQKQASGPNNGDDREMEEKNVEKEQDGEGDGVESQRRNQNRARINIEIDDGNDISDRPITGNGVVVNSMVVNVIPNSDQVPDVSGQELYSSPSSFSDVVSIGPLFDIMSPSSGSSPFMLVSGNSARRISISASSSPRPNTQSVFRAASPHRNDGGEIFGQGFFNMNRRNSPYSRPSSRRNSPSAVLYSTSSPAASIVPVIANTNDSILTHVFSDDLRTYSYVQIPEIEIDQQNLQDDSPNTLNPVSITAICPRARPLAMRHSERPRIYQNSTIGTGSLGTIVQHRSTTASPPLSNLDEQTATSGRYFRAPTPFSRNRLANGQSAAFLNLDNHVHAPIPHGPSMARNIYHLTNQNRTITNNPPGNPGVYREPDESGASMMRRFSMPSTLASREHPAFLRLEQIGRDISRPQSRDTQSAPQRALDETDFSFPIPNHGSTLRLSTIPLSSNSSSSSLTIGNTISTNSLRSLDVSSTTTGDSNIVIPSPKKENNVTKPE